MSLNGLESPCIRCVRCVLLTYDTDILIRFVLLVLLFNFVMHCIISTVVVAFEINYLILSILYLTFVTDFSRTLRSDICIAIPSVVCLSVTLRFTTQMVELFRSILLHIVT